LPIIMYKRTVKKGIVLGLTFQLLLIASLFPAESRIVLGKGDGFRSFAHMRNVRIIPGFGNDADLVLGDTQEKAEESTDLLLKFDEEPPRDASGSYLVRSQGVVISREHKMRGNGSAAFHRGSSLSLVPQRAPLFSPGTVWGDFTIEFWMYPATLEEGESIFVVRGPLNNGTRVFSQEMSCRISGRALVWEFLNFFQSPETPLHSFVLRGKRPLVPREWRHHMIRFDASTGLVEYLLDGTSEDLIYASRSGREDGSILYPRVGNAGTGPLAIGENFTGFLDEFRISRRYQENPVLAPYSAEGGWTESGPIDLGYHNSALTKIEAKYRTPSNSAVFFYYKIGNSSREVQDKEWEPFIPGNPVASDKKGRFLHLRIELYPDGKGEFSPRLSDLTVVYDKNMPPPPPSYAAAVPGDGSITLRWSLVPDPNLEGYLIYYGSRPGVYDGNESILGPSPIRTGKTTSLTLDGLVNGKLYYFAVSSYDAGGDPLSGLFSQEVSARPSRLYRNENKEKK
jgi:hypothetical protein